MNVKNQNTRHIIRILAAVAAACALLFIFTACSNTKYADSEYTGKWRATTGSMSGITVNIEEILGGEFSLTLKDTGKANVKIDRRTESGEWEETDNGFRLKDSSGELEFTKTADGQVKTNYQGLDVQFEKQ